MEDDPQEFLAERLPEHARIIAHPINTDVDFSRNVVARIREVEAYYIGVFIMAEIIPVDPEQELIRTENIIQAG